MKKLDFPVVGLGASAGGLEALKTFFGKLTKESGLAYIVHVHLSAKQPSLMPELLQRVCPIPVTAAADQERIAPDHVYVVPPDKRIKLADGQIKLCEIPENHSFLPIDGFFRSLAHHQQESAAAIVLSGTGSDGTSGIKDIKANNGLVIIQSEESAAYDGMPRSALSTGVVDLVLAPEEMPARLLQYFAHTRLAEDAKEMAANEQREWLNRIFTLLHTRVGHDFSPYKINTLVRRVNRRMGLNQVPDYQKYLEYLRANPDEAKALFKDLLIGVTSFFRDPDSFTVLSEKVLPAIFHQMRDDDTFRAWIPGCSTGEEVYSLAIVIRETLDVHPKRLKVQLFGTDIDGFAIEKAREGFYAADIAPDVGEDRLRRFFVKEGAGYRIHKEIRDCAVFSIQDLIKDPPFSRLNLLCCRNLLIYLDAEVQKKILPLFHYTLSPDGVLILGSSESIGSNTDLFEPLDKKWKVFRRLEVPMGLRRQINFPSGSGTAELQGSQMQIPDHSVQKVDIGQMTRQAILERFSPTTLLIDSRGLILYVQGRTGRFLETPSGVPTNNVLDMAREGLRIELSSALRAANSSGQMVSRRKIRVRTNGAAHLVTLHLCPLHSPRELAGRLLLAFEETDAPVSDDGQAGVEHEAGDPSLGQFSLASLEKELQHTRESHQTAVEELESSNEELKSTNEELQSANEELQSTNEELESSKEELQSLNEELQTVNAELLSKVEELSAAHDDMHNLLNGTEIATIFVDNDLRIRRFTPQATSIINLIQADIGRPLQHVVSNLAYEGMITDLEDVLKSLTTREQEVQTKNNLWYKMRVMPYRTTDNRIDGAVLTFASINDQKQVQEMLQIRNVEISQAWHLVRDVLDLTNDPLVVLDQDARVVLMNTSFEVLMDVVSDAVVGTKVTRLCNGVLKIPTLIKKLDETMAHGGNFQLKETNLVLPKESGTWEVKGQVVGVESEQNLPYRILLQFIREQ